MSTKRQIDESSGIYFITITCYEWMPLFESIKGYDIVYKWFDYLKQLGHYVTGYVIMPNHLHALIAFRHSDKSINSVIGNGKRFYLYAESPGRETPLGRRATNFFPSGVSRFGDSALEDTHIFYNLYS